MQNASPAREHSRYPEPSLLIDGLWEAGEGNPGGIQDVIDPASEERLARPPAASTRQVEAAVAAAARSLAEWATLGGEKRADLLRRAADILAGTVDADAVVMTREQGKTLAESRAEMISVIELF